MADTERFVNAGDYTVQRYVCRLVKDGRAQRVTRDYVPGTESAVALFEPLFLGLAHEEIWIATCNAANRIQGLVRVSQGGLHGAAIRPVDVLRPVIASGHGAFLMAHNHPSGDPAPSHADLEMTRLLVKASEIVGVTLLDHIVWAGVNRWRSLRDSMPFD